MEYLAPDPGPSGTSVHVARFAGPSGVDEYHLTVRPTNGDGIDGALARLADAYRGAVAALGLDERSAVLRRFFCSDLPNQADALERCPVSARRQTDVPCAVSWVGQPPVPTAKVALWAYHIDDPAGLDAERRDGCLTVRRGRLGHRWSTGLTSVNGHTPYAQTRGVFSRYEGRLARDGMSLADHVVRTWLYVQNIDTDYRDMVVARRELFAERGLTPDTHFIASSGIGGRWVEVNASVVMDAYAIAGVQPAQVRYLAAPDHLGPTHAYGVTFERATAISYRDRRHVLLSGTASIDPEGRILHPGDVARQLDRTLDNIAALLASADATLDDMCAYVVYVRDPGDHELVWRAIRSRCGAAPVAVVVAPVCRPGWLVEVEGLAVVPVADAALPEF